MTNISYSDFFKEKLIQYVGKAEQVTGQTIDLLQKEIPDILQQILIYTMVKNIVFMALPLLVLIGLIIVTVVLFKKDMIDPSDEFSLFILFPYMLVGGWLIVALMAYLGETIMIIFAPKVFLIQYISDLVRGR